MLLNFISESLHFSPPRWAAVVITVASHEEPAKWPVSFCEEFVCVGFLTEIQQDAVDKWWMDGFQWKQKKMKESKYNSCIYVFVVFSSCTVKFLNNLLQNVGPYLYFEAC